MLVKNSLYIFFVGRKDFVSRGNVEILLLNGRLAVVLDGFVNDL